MFSSVTPDGQLGEFVSTLWLQEGQSPDRGAQLRLPTGTAELVVSLAADFFWLPADTGARQRYPGAVVAGPYRHAYLLDTARQSHVAGVVFRPGRARAVLGVPLHELADRHVALTDLWGAGAPLVRERLLAAPDAASRLGALEAALRERLTGAAHPLATAATTWLSRVPGRPGVGELGDRLGWTARRVQQVFRTEVGLTPKAYQRLLRFRAVLADIDGATRFGWSAFAVAHGYYDQAHLAREFRVHSGLSPTAYLLARGGQLNHVPLPG